MIRNGGKLVLMALIMAVTPLTASAQVGDTAVVAAMSQDAQDAAKMVDAFHAALVKGDGVAAAVLLSEDALLYEGGHAERSKAEYASHHAGADAVYAAAVPSELLRRSGFADGAMAWIASETRTTGVYNDQPIDRITTETMALRRTPEGWRIAHIHWSSRAAT